MHLAASSFGNVPNLDWTARLLAEIVNKSNLNNIYGHESIDLKTTKKSCKSIRFVAGVYNPLTVSPAER